jgi:hypothetical protein
MIKQIRLSMGMSDWIILDRVKPAASPVMSAMPDSTAPK